MADPTSLTVMPVAAPLQVVLHAATGALELAFDDGLHRTLSGARLRQACRCAGCEHTRRRGGSPDVTPDVRLCDLHPMGASAVQLRFSDGHERGIYPWAYLHELARHAPAAPDVTP